MKIFTGKVISKKMDKTATVVVSTISVHPLYKKRFKRNKKYQVHDEIGVNIGEAVKFTATKPYSKLKKWKIITVSNQKTKKKTKTKQKSRKIK